ncbi:MAG TPA: hypothetical protein PLK77_11945, partial [Pyrinomonadaceae bacterium]|nr:hypothetical protein [Pyrinomonadaceae bacterium]
DVYLVLPDEVRDPHRTQHAEGVSDRDVHYIFGRQEIQTMLPFIGGAQGDENFVTAIHQPAGKVRDVPLAAAESP